MLGLWLTRCMNFVSRAVLLQVNPVALEAIGKIPALPFAPIDH